MDHRKPPKPKSYDTAPKGTCRWCNKKIIGKNGKQSLRASWHPKCVTEYKLIHWPGVTRRAVFKRDRGICATCGHQCGRKGKDVWHMDHIKPLIESEGDLSYWKLGNLQTLCQRCHFAKTGREATARAEARRQRKASPPSSPTSKVFHVIFNGIDLVFGLVILAGVIAHNSETIHW